MKKTAFTLIELLVVISIIAILAGIALPVFQKVQEKGRATDDANNLRQLGIGMVAYFGDHDDTMSKDLKTTWPGTDDTTKPDGLYPKYISGAKTFHSPFDKSRTGLATAVSYGLSDPLFDANSNGAINMSSVMAASSTIMMAPAYTGDPEVPGTWTGTTTAALNVKPTTPTKGTHSNKTRINVVFCDSHIDTLKLTDFQKVITDKLDPDYRRWNPYTAATP